MLHFISKEDVWRCLDLGLHNKLGWQPLNIHLKTWQDIVIYEKVMNSVGKRIAEIGGGTSRILERLAPTNECYNVDRFAGADGGPVGEHTIKGVRNVLAFLGEYHPDLESNSFDTVVSVSVVEHVPLEAGQGFIDDHIRIMKPGGVAVHAIDMYCGDSETDFNRRRLEMYQGWCKHPSVEPLGKVDSGPAVFRAWMCANPDMTMWRWNQAVPQMKAVRASSQCTSLLLGFRKKDDV